MLENFVVISRGETLQVAASKGGAHLSSASSAHLGAVMMGRLHYVEDFKRRFPRVALHSLTSFAAIVLASFREYGREALEHLEGEFALAIWDRRTREIVALRDPLGGYPLFWVERGGDVALSCVMQPLLDVLGEARPSRDYVADYLTRPTLALDEPATETTSMHGVFRVLPGSIMTFRYPGPAVTRHQHWRWQDKAIDAGSDRTEDIAEQVREHLVAAVRERTMGRTAAHFSGGMDSTAVALLARDCLRDRTDGPLHALTLDYQAFATLKGERRFVDAGLAGQSGLVAHRVAADDLLAYDSFQTPPAFDEPFAGLLDFAKDQAMFAAASRAGAEVILTGEGGDDVLDVPPFAIAGMIRRGHLPSAWRESARWARAYATDPWQIFCQYGLDHLLPVGLRAGLGAALRRGRVDWSRQSIGTIAPWVREDFARRHDLRARMITQSSAFFRSTPDVGLSVALASIQCRVGDRRRWSLANANGMSLSHPFLDPRLLRLGLGVRRRYRQDPALQKPLLAHAMRDVLPPEIRNRRGKTHFNEVYFRGLARNRVALERMIEGVPIDALGIFDKGALISCLRQTAMGVEFSAHGSTQLDLALSLVRFLSNPRPAVRQDLMAIEQEEAAPQRAA